MKIRHLSINRENRLDTQPAALLMGQVRERSQKEEEKEEEEKELLCVV